jgi:hypothetical protein
VVAVGLNRSFFGVVIGLWSFVAHRDCGFPLGVDERDPFGIFEFGFGRQERQGVLFPKKTKEPRWIPNQLDYYLR